MPNKRTKKTYFYAILTKLYANEEEAASSKGKRERKKVRMKERTKDRKKLKNIQVCKKYCQVHVHERIDVCMYVCMHANVNFCRHVKQRNMYEREHNDMCYVWNTRIC